MDAPTPQRKTHHIPAMPRALIEKFNIPLPDGGKFDKNTLAKELSRHGVVGGKIAFALEELWNANLLA